MEDILRELAETFVLIQALDIRCNYGQPVFSFSFLLFQQPCFLPLGLVQVGHKLAGNSLAFGIGQLCMESDVIQNKCDKTILLDVVCGASGLSVVNVARAPVNAYRTVL